MKRKLIDTREARIPFLAAIAIAIGLMAIGSQVRAAEVAGNATLTTDYVWRGTTQTQSDPAVQAGVKIAGRSGLYASLWGSNVEFAPDTRASSEFDIAVGWSSSLSDDWALDVGAVHYRYPSTTVDLDWTELNGTLTYAGHYWLSLAYSPEALGGENDGVYALVGARFRADERVRFETALGHYALDGDGYTHAQASAIWTIKPPYELRVTAHGTDHDAERLFGDDLAGTRVEAALQTSF